MPSYAQSNIQLLNRMREAEYSQAELVAVRDAYRYAMRLFACRFEPSGRVFIAHVVRTAGILVSLRAPAPIVVAGLLHNAYQNGDFGSAAPGATNAKRENVRAVVGEEAESYIFGFAGEPWNANTLRTLRESLQRDGPESLSLHKRNTLLLRFADHLEHELDLDPLYVINNRYQALTGEVGAAMIEIAELLHYPTLAAELRRTSSELKTAHIPEQLRSSKARSELWIPASHCLRFGVVAQGVYYRARRKLAPLRYRWRSALARKAG